MIPLVNITWWLFRRLNKYWITFIIFIIVTFLMGDSTIFKRISYRQQIITLRQEIEFNKRQKKEKIKRLKMLHGKDNESLEKLAREQYFMTKSNEELFVVKHM